MRGQERQLGQQNYKAMKKEHVIENKFPAPRNIEAAVCACDGNLFLHSNGLEIISHLICTDYLLSKNISLSLRKTNELKLVYGVSMETVHWPSWMLAELKIG